MRICEKVTFFPHEIPFHEVTLNEHLTQAADDIVSILAQPPPTTVPSLQVGDTIRNALLEIATQLRRVEKIPNRPEIPAGPPRVETTTNQPGQAPRVDKNQPPTTSLLQEKSTTPLRFRFQPPQTNKYNLRSRVQKPWKRQTSFQH